MFERIRSYQSDDQAHAEALWARVGPYRPGDGAEVQAMHERARRARKAGDRWIGKAAPIPLCEDAPTVCSAGWVAIAPLDGGSDRVVGFVEVVGSGAVPEMSPDMPLGQEWGHRSDVAQLTRFCVLPELWRRGVGTRLTQTAIEWCRDNGFRTLVLNTTSPQIPALCLYRNLGFREAGRSFLDKYELVWHELEL